MHLLARLILILRHSQLGWGRMVRMFISKISGHQQRKLQRLFNQVYCQICLRVHMKLLRKGTLCGISCQSQKPSCTHGNQVLHTFMSHHISKA
nr:hypothetical protein Iba_chr09eCG13120 [Ipomoea batatas]